MHKKERKAETRLWCTRTLSPGLIRVAVVSWSPKYFQGPTLTLFGRRREWVQTLQVEQSLFSHVGIAGSVRVQGCRMGLAAGSHHERQATSGQLSLASLRKRGRYRWGSPGSPGRGNVLHRLRRHVGGTHATWAVSVGGLAGNDQRPPSHRVKRRRRGRLLLVVVAGESQSSRTLGLHMRRWHPCATPFDEAVEGSGGVASGCRWLAFSWLLPMS